MMCGAWVDMADLGRQLCRAHHHKPEFSVGLFFVADMHFGNSRNAKARGFSSPEAMDQAICDAWCARVREGDTVWVLGDVGEVSPLQRLPGEKHLVYGNDDRPKSRLIGSECFQSLQDFHLLETDCGPIELVHRPRIPENQTFPFCMATRMQCLMNQTLVFSLCQ